jgi:hypothetical protein
MKLLVHENNILPDGIPTGLYSRASLHEQIFQVKNVSDDERFLGLGTRKPRVSARESVAG